MRVMIHAAPARMWYVKDFLVPRLRAQGLKKDQILIWNDKGRRGNLRACMDAFASCEGVPGGTWHLQDDVLPAPDFVRRAAEHDRGIVAGFACRAFEHRRGLGHTGLQPPGTLWYSFQCLRIPNDVAAACAAWFETVKDTPDFTAWTATGKKDDQFFRAFLQAKLPGAAVENLVPSLVEHVDWLVGGSLANQGRALRFERAAFWADEALVEELEKELKDYELQKESGKRSADPGRAPAAGRRTGKGRAGTVSRKRGDRGDPVVRGDPPDGKSPVRKAGGDPAGTDHP